MTSRSKGNPFAQSPGYWKVTFQLPADAVSTTEESFNDMTLAVSAFETDEPNHIWTMELLCGSPPDMDEVQRRLLVICKLHNIEMPKTDMQKLEQQDWLAAVARGFPPLSIGRFYVHGSHVSEVPVGAIAIKVDAGAAFGSGEHGTTRCCLEALDWMGRNRVVRRALDMGCGSGILAIAIAKLWRADVLAVDIDPVAVRVSQTNVQVNRETARVTTAVSDGYNCEQIRKVGRFDLIMSNILARPLIKFAPDLEKHLAPGGMAVLSGLLVDQEQQVLSAHLMQGLKLHKRFVHEDWCTLVLKRK